MRWRTCAPPTGSPKARPAWSHLNSGPTAAWSASSPSMARAGSDLSKPVLEVNPTHPLVTALAGRVTAEGARQERIVEDARLAAA